MTDLEAATTAFRDGRLTDAERVFSTLVDHANDGLAARLGLARIAVRRNDWPLAVARWRAALDLNERHRGALRGLARACHLTGDAQGAEVAFQAMLNIDSDDVDALLGLADLRHRAGAYDDALAFTQRARTADAQSTRVSQAHARALQHTNRPSEARMAIEGLIGLLGQPSSAEDLIALCRGQAALGRRADARSTYRQVIDAVAADMRPAHFSHLVDLFKLHSSLGEFRDDLTRLSATSKGADDVAVDAQLALSWIVADVPDRAERIARTIGFGTVTARPDLNRLFSWLHHRLGDIDAAQRCHARTVWPHTPQFASALDDRAHDLRHERRSPALADVEPGDIVLFAKARNEAARLPMFLNHYRSLGVDHFVVIDNGSTDETVNVLVDNGVTVFYSSDPLLAAGDGARWINHLSSSYAPDNWVLAVDIDEHLVFAGAPDLRDLLDRCERRGDTLIGSFMLDMHSGTLGARSTDWWFDTDYQSIGAVQPPYWDMIGGFRPRLYDHESHPVLGKVPLIRTGRGVRWLAANHWTTPGAVSMERTALLHFKFAVEPETRAAFDHGSKSAQFGYAAHEPSPTEFSRRWQHPHQLAELGLM